VALYTAETWTLTQADRSKLEAFEMWIWMEKDGDKKLSYCWVTVQCESMPRIAEMDVKMTT